MEQGSLSQCSGAIGFALLVHQERKLYACLFPEKTRVGHVAEADGRQPGSSALKRLFVFAQLRNVFAAEDSAVVTEEDKDGWAFGPQRSEPDAVTVRIGKRDPGKLAAQRFGHAGHSPVQPRHLSSC